MSDPAIHSHEGMFLRPHQLQAVGPGRRPGGTSVPVRSLGPGELVSARPEAHP